MVRFGLPLSSGNEQHNENDEADDEEDEWEPGQIQETYDLNVQRQRQGHTHESDIDVDVDIDYYSNEEEESIRSNGSMNDASLSSSIIPSWIQRRINTQHQHCEYEHYNDSDTKMDMDLDTDKNTDTDMDADNGLKETVEQDSPENDHSHFQYHHHQQQEEEEDQRQHHQIIPANSQGQALRFPQDHNQDQTTIHYHVYYTAPPSSSSNNIPWKWIAIIVLVAHFAHLWQSSSSSSSGYPIFGKKNDDDYYTILSDQEPLLADTIPTSAIIVSSVLSWWSSWSIPRIFQKDDNHQNQNQNQNQYLYPQRQSQRQRQPHVHQNRNQIIQNPLCFTELSDDTGRKDTVDSDIIASSSSSVPFESVEQPWVRRQLLRQIETTSSLHEQQQNQQKHNDPYLIWAMGGSGTGKRSIVDTLFVKQCGWSYTEIDLQDLHLHHPNNEDHYDLGNNRQRHMNIEKSTKESKSFSSLLPTWKDIFIRRWTEAVYKEDRNDDMIDQEVLLISHITASTLPYIVQILYEDFYSSSSSVSSSSLLNLNLNLYIPKVIILTTSLGEDIIAKTMIHYDIDTVPLDELVDYLKSHLGHYYIKEQQQQKIDDYDQYQDGNDNRKEEEEEDSVQQWLSTQKSLILPFVPFNSTMTSNVFQNAISKEWSTSLSELFAEHHIAMEDMEIPTLIIRDEDYHHSEQHAYQGNGWQNALEWETWRHKATQRERHRHVVEGGHAIRELAKHIVGAALTSSPSSSSCRYRVLDHLQNRKKNRPRRSHNNGGGDDDDDTAADVPPNARDEMMKAPLDLPVPVSPLLLLLDLTNFPSILRLYQCEDNMISVNGHEDPSNVNDCSDEIFLCEFSI